MSNVLRWTVEESDQIQYNYAYIYSATTEGGTYTNIASQAITDNTYNDEDGAATTWYKVRFYNSSTDKWSAYSDALQAGKHVGYCSIDDVRDMTNLTTSDVSDTDVYNLIVQATKELNRMMNVLIVREKIEYIDPTRQNKIDGSNKTYYVKNWQGKYLADMANDGDVDTSDIIVYAVDSDDVETEATVDSITSDEGKFVLNTAYASTYELYVTYEWCYKDPSVPDPLINLACTLLTSAYCYAKVNVGMAPQESFGNIKIYRHMESFDHYYKRYLSILSQINNQMIDTKETDLV